MRSLLFAPAHHPVHRVKVFSAGADAVIIDLEDAVAAKEKNAARTKAVEALSTPHDCPAFIRINGIRTEFCFGDILAVACERLDGIVLPMANRGEDLRLVDWLLTQIEADRGLAPGKIEIMPIVETAEGITHIDEIAAGPRVRRMMFGAGDFTNDLGLEWTGDETEFLYARSRIVIASRNAGIEPPIDTVHVNIADLAGLHDAALRVRKMGFGGKCCIYPKQLAVVHAVFTASEAELQKAERIVAHFRATEKAGSAATTLDGCFVDYPIVFRAERLLRAHGRLAVQTASEAS